MRYRETDQMAIAHHGNYITWFEVGRTDLCRAVGVTYRDIEDLGFLLVVAEVGCKYRVPYRYDDEVLIRTSVGESASRSLRFDYELYDATGTALHASGFSRHFWVDRETRRPVVPPADLRSRFTP